MALATDFIWTGQGTDQGWDNPDNWNQGSGYPDDTGDTAMFPDHGGIEWTVNKETHTIGTLTFEEDTKLTIKAEVITANTVVLDATGLSSAQLRVRVTDGKVIGNP